LSLGVLEEYRKILLAFSPDVLKYFQKDFLVSTMPENRMKYHKLAYDEQIKNFIF
jgi:hypothetical protein